MEDKAGDVPRLLKPVQAAEDATGTLDAKFIHLAQPSLTHFRSGEIILGRFRIIRHIGSGGMGDVYEAEDLQLGRVALKTIRQDIASSSEVFDRFRQEVQLARKISGSQVCRIHELYLIPAAGNRAATAFLTMEYLDGATLAQRLKRSGPLPLKQAQRVALDICEGLRLVHAQGVIHRDLKSANIMLCGEGDSMRAVLMDFGLAHDSGVPGPKDHTSPVAAAQAGTLHGSVMGTPAYMAPEQFEGNPVSPATDIYALGIVLYELVTGLHPYAAPTPVAAAIRRAHRPEPPSSLIHSIPRKWDRIIQQCLQYEPNDRFQSADEVAKALRAGLANLANLRKDWPWLFAVACALVATCLVWGVLSWWQTRQYYHPGPEALRQYTNGLSLIRQGNYAEATRVLQAALGIDKHFVMAHARLAEAWYNLDFQGNAQQELLIALPESSRLPPLDRKYLDAIHATVTGDPSGALGDYKQILDDLPSSEKSSGYVDLGMAYERAGDIPHSLDSYSHAAALDGNNPAAYMHTGILQSRLHHVREGEEAFSRAQAIFENQIDSYGRKENPEGIAELDYERGYAANDRGDSKDAEPLLENALDEAKQIPSVQLQIRVLTQLATVEFKAEKDAQVEKYAQDAIDLARRKQLDSWAANGLVRLASDRIVLGNLAGAEMPLEEAMEILSQSPQPRVQALANSTYASLMDQEHHPDKVEEPAQAALDYYRRNGFSEGATEAGRLVIRAKRDKGEYKQALDDGNALLALAKQSGLAGSQSRAEEELGSVYLAMENYPDALTHFENARALASSDLLRSYQELHCGETLRRLGRYAESDVMLQLAKSNPAPPHIADVDESHVESLLSQEHYAPALQLEREMIARVPDDAHKRYELQDTALAESHLGMKKPALDTLAALASLEQGKSAPEEAAENQMVAAEVYLWLQMNSQAYDTAAGAEAFFVSTRQLDSELRSAYLAAAAARSLKNQGSYEMHLKKAIDIGNILRQNWGPEAFQRYLSRPDMRTLSQRAAR